MDIRISDFGDSCKRVALVGKLDIAGAGKIELPFATLAGAKQNVVVDMTAVEFIASIGIRHLVMAADALARASCRLVLLGPTPLVTNVLANTGLQDILPIVRSEDDARAVFASPPAG